MSQNNEHDDSDYIEVNGHRIRRTRPAEAPSPAEAAPPPHAPQAPTIAPANSGSDIGLVIGVVSGKGGVGKSLITALSAVLLRRMGLKTAILDADITGPSIPKMFGVKRAGGGVSDESDEIYPGESNDGIKMMSLNFLMPNETDPVIWRGPVIAGVVRQFWTDVRWGDIDVMLVDMPPGTGDVPLTVFQSLPVDGIVVVTTPQELVSMIVEKAINMAETMNIPVTGLVENMSYIACPHCGKPIYPFGDTWHDAGAIRRGIDVVGRLPIDPTFAALSDEGRIADAQTEDLGLLTEKIKNMLDEKRAV